MASATRCTWVWVNSGSWWWTGRPGVLRFVGSQRVGHDWATELKLHANFIYCTEFWMYLSNRKATLDLIVHLFCDFPWREKYVVIALDILLTNVLLHWKVCFQNFYLETTFQVEGQLLTYCLVYTHLKMFHLWDVCIWFSSEFTVLINRYL